MSLRIHLERFPSTLLSSIALTPLRFPNVITTRVPSEKVLFGEEVVLFEEDEAVLFEEEEVVLFEEEEVVLFEEVDVLFEDVLFEDDDFVSFFFINLDVGSGNNPSFRLPAIRPVHHSGSSVP